MAITSPEPDPYADSFSGAVTARAVGVAADLGVFEALHTDRATPTELAERLELDPPGVEALTTALRALGYVDRGADGRLGNAAVTERLLVADAPDSIATFCGGQADLHWEILACLPAVLRSGRPYALHTEHPDHERWEAYMRGLYEISRPEHATNAAAVAVESPRTLVDVAGGHGGFAMAMCELHPALVATVLDLPPAAAVGRRIVAERGMEDRVGFREGDVFEVGLGDGLDVVSAFNLIHHLPEERDRELCARAFEALRPGGQLVIGDSERPDPEAPVDQTGALSSLLFYAWSRGRNFSAAEIEGWLGDAGFEAVGTHRNERSPWRIVVSGRVPR